MIRTKNEYFEINHTYIHGELTVIENFQADVTPRLYPYICFRCTYIFYVELTKGLYSVSRYYTIIQ